jgi:hypothetical protein
VQSVGPDLHKETPDPYTHNPDPRIRSRTPKLRVGSLWMGVRIPPSKVRTTHNEVPGQGISWPKQGSSTGTCPGFILCTCAPRSGGDPMLPHGLLPVT